MTIRLAANGSTTTGEPCIILGWNVGVYASMVEQQQHNGKQNASTATAISWTCPHSFGQFAFLWDDKLMVSNTPLVATRKFCTTPICAICSVALPGVQANLLS
jgi:hypothetical protein